MAKTVLLLGLRADLLETVKQELQTPGIDFVGGTGVADVEAALRQATIDHVIIGARHARAMIRAVPVRAFTAGKIRLETTRPHRPEVSAARRQDHFSGFTPSTGPPAVTTPIGQDTPVPWSGQ